MSRSVFEEAGKSDSSVEPRRPPARGALGIAYTPDSDDAFNYYAWEHGKVGIPNVTPTFDRHHIIALNRAAENEAFDVVGVSSAAFPRLADRYWVLSVGNSVGRGYGPVLVARDYEHIEQLRGKRIAVGGIPTTGSALAAMYCPDAEFHEMRYDTIADAVADGRFDAGVMIHEELLFFPSKGLRAVCDLGTAWCRETGLPLPVGLNVVRKALGRPLAEQVASACRRSLEWGLNHFDEAFAFASRFGRGCSRRHVEMFSNQDTLHMADDVREALSLMLRRVADLNLGPRVESFEVIDG